MPSSGFLTVTVLEAQGLSPELAGESHICLFRWTAGWGSVRPQMPGPPPTLVCLESYVKVQLVLNQKKWKKKKTSSKKGTTVPYFNEAFTFLVPFS